MKFLMTAIALVSFSAFAADKSSPEMMKKWEEYSTPGEQHKFLSGFEGNWTYTQKMWQTKDAKPEEATGTATMKMVMGGRYLQQEVKGTAMGQPYEGMGFTGYDNLKKETTSTWMDNMGTGLLTGEGKVDLKKKTITEEGEFTCPMEKDNDADYRSEWVSKDKDTMTFTMYSDAGGKGEFKMMEMTYKRTK